MYKHILIPTDGSSLSANAVEQGIGLAKVLGAKVTGITVSIPFHTAALDPLMVSDTAEHGDYTAGPRIVSPAVREEMRRLIAEIRDGSYARGWIEENQHGRPKFEAARTAERHHQIEEVGARLRALMPFLEPVTVQPS